MIVLPIKKCIEMDRLVFCIQCNVLFLEDINTKDHGVCSLACGYKLRGLSQWDFIDSPMGNLESEINKHIDIHGY